MAFAVGYKTFTHAATSAQNVALSGFTDVVGSIGSLQADDYVVVFYAHHGSSSRTLAQCTPSGYSNAHAAVITGTDTAVTSGAVTYKKQTATPDSNVAIPAASSTNLVVGGFILVVRGADLTTFLDVTSTTANGANSGRPNPPSITPSTAGTLIVGFGGSSTGGSMSPLVQAGDYNNFNTNSVSGNQRLGEEGFGLKTDWTSGAFDAGAWTGGTTASDASWIAASIAIRQATGGGGTTLTPGLLTNTQTFYAPTVTRGAVNLAPALLTNTSSFFAATVSPSYTLAPALLSDGDTFFAPTVSPGTVSLQPGLLTNTSTFYAPTVRADAVLSPQLLTNSQAFPAPMVAATYSLAAPLIASTTALYSPVISTGQVVIVPPLISDGDTFFSPTVTPAIVSVYPPLLTNTQVLYGATVTTDGSLAPPLLTNAQTFFAPLVSTGPVQLTAPLISDPDVFFGGAVAVGSVTVSPELLGNTSAFFGPSVEVGPVDLFAPIIANDNHFFAAEVIVSTDQQLLASLYENVVAFPSPTVRNFRVTTVGRPGSGESGSTRPEQLSSARPIATPTTRPVQSISRRPRQISTGRR